MTWKNKIIIALIFSVVGIAAFTGSAAALDTLDGFTEQESETTDESGPATAVDSNGNLYVGDDSGTLKKVNSWSKSVSSDDVSGIEVSNNGEYLFVLRVDFGGTYDTMYLDLRHAENGTLIDSTSTASSSDHMNVDGIEQIKDGVIAASVDSNTDFYTFDSSGLTYQDSYQATDGPTVIDSNSDGVIYITDDDEINKLSYSSGSVTEEYGYFDTTTFDDIAVSDDRVTVSYGNSLRTLNRDLDSIDAETDISSDIYRFTLEYTSDNTLITSKWYDGDPSYKLQIRDKDNLGNVIDSKDFVGDSGSSLVSRSGNYMAVVDGDAGEVWKIDLVLDSLDTSISGNSDSYSITGPETFEVNITATYDDGSTQEVEPTDLSYDSNIISPVSAGVFEGVNSGTTEFEASYTGEYNTVSDSITITVNDPPEITDVSIIEPYAGPYDEDITIDLDTRLNYEDGTEQLITSSDNLYFSTNNTTLATVGAHDGVLTTNYWGEVKVAVSYYDSWYDKNYNATTTYTIWGDPSGIDFNILSDEVDRDKTVEMSSTLLYEDGRSEEMAVNTANVTASPSGYATYDDVNDTVAFSESAQNYTLTYSYDGFTDSDSVYVNTVRDFEDFNKVTPYEQVFILLNNWSFWAIFVSLLGGVLAGYYISSGAGLGVMTIIISVAWLGGFVPIYVAISLVLFDIFVFTVLDTQYIKIS